MQLSHSESIKSFGLILIAGEVGLLSMRPPNPNLVYEDFVTMSSSIIKKTKRDQLSDNDCGFYCSHRGEQFQFDIDRKLDSSHLSDIINRINLNNKMCGSVDGTAVGLNVDYIYSSIGEIFNNDDNYFAVLKELWTSFKLDERRFDEESQANKIKRIQHSFSISDTRIKELLE